MGRIKQFIGPHVAPGLQFAHPWSRQSVTRCFLRHGLRNHPIKADEASVMFVTKCPCDECVPLISGAGITHIYTTDQDRDKYKCDISYLKFSTWNSVSKFIVSPERPLSPLLRSDGVPFASFAQICGSFSVILSAYFCTRVWVRVRGVSLWLQKSDWIISAGNSVFMKLHHVRKCSNLGYLRIPSQGFLLCTE